MKNGEVTYIQKAEIRDLKGKTKPTHNEYRVSEENPLKSEIQGLNSISVFSWLQKYIENGILFSENILTNIK